MNDAAENDTAKLQHDVNALVAQSKAVRARVREHSRGERSAFTPAQLAALSSSE